MELHLNGKNKSISRRRNKRLDPDQQKRLGTARCNCEDTRYEEQSQSAESDRTGRNSSGTSIILGDTPAGKIIKRLDVLESTHYKYVHSHQDRLQARLDESKQLEEQFRQEAAELRQQILELATSEESVEGNGHIS